MDDKLNYMGEVESLDDEANANNGRVRVWVISPHPHTSHWDEMWVRGWQQMLRCVRESLEDFLERDGVAQQLIEGESVSLSFRLEQVPLDEYLESQEAEP